MGIEKFLLFLSRDLLVIVIVLTGLCEECITTPRYVAAPSEALHKTAVSPSFDRSVTVLILYDEALLGGFFLVSP
jgi:hypothetical protein